MISFKAYISPTIFEWKSQKQITVTTARLNKKGKSVLDLKFCSVVHSNDLIKMFIGQKKTTTLDSGIDVSPGIKVHDYFFYSIWFTKKPIIKIIICFLIHQNVSKIRGRSQTMFTR